MFTCISQIIFDFSSNDDFPFKRQLRNSAHNNKKSTGWKAENNDPTNDHNNIMYNIVDIVVTNQRRSFQNVLIWIMCFVCWVSAVYQWYEHFHTRCVTKLTPSHFPLASFHFFPSPFSLNHCEQKTFFFCNLIFFRIFFINTLNIRFGIWIVKKI